MFNKLLFVLFRNTVMSWQEGILKDTRQPEVLYGVTCRAQAKQGTWLSFRLVGCRHFSRICNLVTQGFWADVSSSRAPFPGCVLAWRCLLKPYLELQSLRETAGAPSFYQRPLPALPYCCLALSAFSPSPTLGAKSEGPQPPPSHLSRSCHLPQSSNNLV